MNWVGFQYEFKTFSEVMGDMRNISDFVPLDYAIFALVLVLLFWFYYFLIPTISIINNSLIKDYEKRKKKKLLHNIRMQKEIEEEIEWELREEEKRRVEERLRAFGKM